FTITVDDGERFRDPFSPTHDLIVERRDGGRVVIRPEADLHDDFAVFLPLTEAGRVGMTVVTHNPVGEDGYFMLTLSPGEADGPVVPRDVTVALDVSGSMSGTKIDDAKQALRQLLGTLAPEDRFRLIAFNSRVVPYHDRWTRATPDALREARRWVDDLRAEGGTAVDDALAEAFDSGRHDDDGAADADADDDERLPIVLFLTDGLPSVGERDPDRIAERAERRRGRARVFAFGVGYDVNTYLLDRLTDAGRGATEYLEPGEDVESALGTLAAKVRHPVLTDLEIAGAPVDLVEIYPNTLPDLFAGEELVVLGRWEETHDDRTGRVRVEGRRAGRSERFAVRSTFPARASGNDYLPRLWAARKIGELTRELRLHGHDDELVDEIRRLALRHGIVTEYTAYLVQEPLARMAGHAPPDGAGAADNALPRPAADRRAATGAAAVRAAEEARIQRSASNAADMAEMFADGEAAIERAVAAAGIEARTVGGRVFVLDDDDDEWRDANLGDGHDTRVVDVRAYGSAYFELLRRLPELIPVARAFDDDAVVVVIAGEEIAIRLAEHAGAERLSAEEIDRIIRRFRGS
ncbi:MAG: VWA domain-containing protein, partial [Gemmatimonadota bacterium]